MPRLKSASRENPPCQTAKAFRYSSLWIEGLAYHEAGHAVMALVLSLPIRRVAIAEACDLPESNGLVEYADLKNVTSLQYALCNLASDPAERLAPNYHRFKTLRGFARGRRNDKVVAFNGLAPAYLFARLAKSTALRAFRHDTQPLVSGIMGQPENQKTVHGVAEFLMAHKRMDSETIMDFQGQTILPVGLLRSL